MLTPYPWQESAWQRVCSMITNQRLPHALLLSGNEGMGLEHFALLLSQRLLCLGSYANGMCCGTCQSCQLVAAGTHPDILKIEPEEQGKQIRIAKIQGLIQFVNLKSFSNRGKLAIILPAEAMNRATANALLKTLEEPPKQSTLVLISHFPERLPITIRSRCQRIEFKPEFSEATLGWLRRQNMDTDVHPEALLQLAGGGPLKALDIIEHGVLQKRLDLIEGIKTLSQGQFDPVHLAITWESLGCKQVIIWLMQICQDIVRIKFMKNKAKLTNNDLRPELLELGKRLELPHLIRFYTYLQHKYEQATSGMNYNPLSILEEIIIYWDNPSKLL